MGSAGVLPQICARSSQLLIASALLPITFAAALFTLLIFPLLSNSMTGLSIVCRIRLFCASLSFNSRNDSLLSSAICTIFAAFAIRLRSCSLNFCLFLKDSAVRQPTSLSFPSTTPKNIADFTFAAFSDGSTASKSSAEVSAATLVSAANSSIRVSAMEGLVFRKM